MKEQANNGCRYIGIDLGTSAMKLLLLNGDGTVANSVSEEYPLLFPQPGWSEQAPDRWWDALLRGMKRLLSGFDAASVRGIGCGGQMHGLVVLDQNDRVLRPAILWNDGRTAEETAYLNETIGRERLSERTANIAFAGFTVPKLLWMKRHEPEKFSRIAKIMLPKDYINYRLTGVHACDYSDASGMLLLDVKNKRWSDEMLSVCSVKREQMPRLFESSDVIGTVKADAAEALGLPEGVRVVAGAGDNAAAAVGTGTVGNGACNISLGTSGTVFIASDAFGVDPNNALHAFCHADGNYHLMGCMLSAASCNKWLCETVLKTDDYAAEQAGITTEMLGNNRVYFLPYLMGERSPINDTDARGLLIGLSMDTQRVDLVQAVLEGVAFAIRDSFEVVERIGISIERSKLCGGGAKSPLWRTILANVLNLPLDLVQTEEGPGYGAAMLAMVGCGAYPSVKACAEALVRVTKTVLPDPVVAARYEAAYEKFRRIYPSVKDLFRTLK